MSFFDPQAEPRFVRTGRFPCPYCGHDRSSAADDCEYCGWQAPRSAKAKRREERTERRQVRREELTATVAGAKEAFAEAFAKSINEQTTGRVVTSLILMPYTIYRWRNMRHAQKRSYWAIPYNSQDYEEVGRMTILRLFVAPVVTALIKAVRERK